MSRQDKLDEDSNAAYTKPLRVLDSKIREVQALLNDAPVLGDYLDEELVSILPVCANCLRARGIAYTVNQRLVRGLDYYKPYRFRVG